MTVLGISRGINDRFLYKGIVSTALQKGISFLYKFLFQKPCREGFLFQLNLCPIGNVKLL